MQRDPKSNHAAKLLLCSLTKWRRTIFFTFFTTYVLLYIVMLQSKCQYKPHYIDLGGEL